MVTRVKQFNGDGVVVTCLQSKFVGFCDFRSFKLFLNPLLGLFKRPDKQPLYNTKREKVFAARTEERRVGKEGRSRWCPSHSKKK